VSSNGIIAKKNLISVILAHLPDVIALEECDHFSDWFQPKLEKEGYEGIFYPKPYKPANAPQADGTALFWRKDKFKLLKQSYSQYSPEESQGVVLVLLENSTEPGKNVCVAATHLKASLGFEERRETQGKILLQTINNFIPEKDYPVIILGDFNDTPDSAVHKVMRESYTSAYEDKPGHWTTWKKRKEEVKRTIDYIWYCSGKLRATHILAIPEDKDCPLLLPAEYHPSDHMMIAAKFSFL